MGLGQFELCVATVAEGHLHRPKSEYQATVRLFVRLFYELTRFGEAFGCAENGASPKNLGYLN